VLRVPPHSLVLGLSTLAVAAMTACNQPPTAPDVVINPAEPTTLDDLVAERTADATDPNKNDSLSYAYAWEVRAAGASETAWDTMDDISGATVPASMTEKGQSWRVSVTVSDGAEVDTYEMEQGVTIANSLPEVVSVRLSPNDGVDTFGTLTASASATDVDGDEVEIDYVWYVNGTILDVEGNILTGQYFDKNDEVWVEAVPFDGEADGEPAASNAVTILNTPPRIEGVTITPDEIIEATEVLCEPIGWYDADDDTPQVESTWMVNGVEVEGVTGPLSGEYFKKDDLIRCMGAPTDGDSVGDVVVSEVVKVLNTPPTISTVTLSSTDPIAAEPLTFTTDASDADGDVLDLTAEWYVDGTLVHTGDELPIGSFIRGQEIYVTVTANDGLADGEPATSTTVVGANSPPNLEAVNLIPDPAYTDSTLFPDVVAVDLDGDPVTYTVTWTVNGSTIAETGSVLDGDVWFDKDDTVSVQVTPNDGFDDGPTLSSSTITILNSVPTTPVISMDPEKPKSDDDLWCAVDTESTDADGDDLTYTFTWTRNGSPFTDTDTLDYEGDYVDTEFTEDKDRFTCTLEVSDGTDSVEVSLAVDVLDWAGPRNFTTCGKTGYRGPSLSQCASAYSGTPLDGAVSIVKDGWQEWEVPQDGTYRIEAWGAQGGRGRYGSNDGAKGARVRGDFDLEEGEKVWVLAGQMGAGEVGSYSAGGGGASWVMKSDGTVLLAAAGGGGNGYAYGSASTCGGQASGYPRRGATSSYGSCSTFYRTEGYGGSYYYRYTGTRYYYGGGGAGYRGDGTTYYLTGSSAQAATDGSYPMRGGDGYYVDGGFGGGGVGGYTYRYSWGSTYRSSSYGSGGGGGYTGGDGGYYRAGGGSSKNFGDNKSDSSNTHTGPGRVTIDLAP